jgi:uncharacterized protein (TIGR00369 family)
MSVINVGLDPERFEFLSANIAGTPIYATYGIRLLELGPGYTRFELLDKAATNSSGRTIHGGIQMVLADTAMGNAVRTNGCRTVTIDQKSSFLLPATNDTRITCVGRVVKAGGHIFHTVGETYADEVLVTYHTASYFKIGPEPIDK